MKRRDFFSGLVSSAAVMSLSNSVLADNKENESMPPVKKILNLSEGYKGEFLPDDFRQKEDIDDTESIQLAVSEAIKNGGGVVSFIPGKVYNCSSSINISFDTQSSINLTLDGNGAVLLSSGERFSLFSFEFNKTAELESKFEISNFSFKGSGKRLTCIESSYACWINIINCKFEFFHLGIKHFKGLRCDTSYCSFWHCSIGLQYTSTRDSVIDTCHVYSCSNGIVCYGTNNVSSDGNLSIVNSTVNVCSNVGVIISGLYTPRVIGLTVEKAVIGLLIKNSNYGVIDNLWVGPCQDCSLVICLKDGDDMTNDYWQISNISVQDSIKISNLRYSQINNLLVYSIHAKKYSYAVGIDRSIISITNFMCHDINLPRSMVINSSSVNVVGGMVERSIQFDDFSQSSSMGVFFKNGELIKSNKG